MRTTRTYRGKPQGEVKMTDKILTFPRSLPLHLSPPLSTEHLRPPFAPQRIRMPLNLTRDQPSRLGHVACQDLVARMPRNVSAGYRLTHFHRRRTLPHHLQMCPIQSNQDLSVLHDAAMHLLNGPLGLIGGTETKQTKAAGTPRHVGLDMHVVGAEVAKHPAETLGRHLPREVPHLFKDQNESDGSTQEKGTVYSKKWTGRATVRTMATKAPPPIFSLLTIYPCPPPCPSLDSTYKDDESLFLLDVRAVLSDV